MTIILLTYVNRSGSTYLANLLSASGNICTCPEGDPLVTLFLESPGKKFYLDEAWKAKLAHLMHSDRKLKAWGMGEDIFDRLQGIGRNLDAFIAFLECYRTRQKPQATGILFKAERLVDLFCDIEKFRTANTDIKYLSMIRDPRAVYASQKRTIIPGTNKRMSRNPVFTAIFWNHFMRRTARNRKNLEQHEIAYHNLVRGMKESINGLSRYLAMDLVGVSPEAGDLPDRLPDADRTIHRHISESPDNTKIDQWSKELSSEEIRLISQKCRRFLAKEGFYVESRQRLCLTETGKIIYFTLVYSVIQLAGSVTFHIKKVFS